MKTKELIEELQKCNPDAKVVVYDNRGNIKTVDWIYNPNPATSALAVAVLPDKCDMPEDEE